MAMSRQGKPNLPRLDRPNHVVKIVFATHEVDDPELQGLKIYLEVKNRPVGPHIQVKEDCTLAESWGCQVYDFIREQLRRMGTEESGITYYETIKKEDMS